MRYVVSPGVPYDLRQSHFEANRAICIKLSRTTSRELFIAIPDKTVMTQIPGMFEPVNHAEILISF